MRKSKTPYIRPLLVCLMALASLSGCVTNAVDRDIVETRQPAKAPERPELDPYPRYQTPVPPPDPTPDLPTKELPIVPLNERET